MAAPHLTQLTDAERDTARSDLGKAEAKLAHLDAVLRRWSLNGATRSNLEAQREGYLLERYLLRSILEARTCCCGLTYYTTEAMCPRCQAIDAQPCPCGRADCTRGETSF